MSLGTHCVTVTWFEFGPRNLQNVISVSERLQPQRHGWMSERRFGTTCLKSTRSKNLLELSCLAKLRTGSNVVSSSHQSHKIHFTAPYIHEIHNIEN